LFSDFFLFVVICFAYWLFVVRCFTPFFFSPYFSSSLQTDTSPFSFFSLSKILSL